MYLWNLVGHLGQANADTGQTLQGPGIHQYDTGTRTQQTCTQNGSALKSQFLCHPTLHTSWIVRHLQFQQLEFNFLIMCQVLLRQYQ